MRQGGGCVGEKKIILNALQLLKKIPKKQTNKNSMNNSRSTEISVGIF